jgi:hypothetical protein
VLETALEAELTERRGHDQRPVNGERKIHGIWADDVARVPALTASFSELRPI